MISSIAGSLASSWTANLFAKLDTANNGYIDTASLTEALTQASSGSADSAAEAQNLVGALDENGDAKLTQQELAASLQKLLEEVGSQVFAEMAPYRGPSGEPTKLVESIFSTIPGSPAYVAKASRYRAQNPRLGIDLDLAGHNAIQGHFAFQA